MSISLKVVKKRGRLLRLDQSPRDGAPQRTHWHGFFFTVAALRSGRFAFEFGLFGLGLLRLSLFRFGFRFFFREHLLDIFFQDAPTGAAAFYVLSAEAVLVQQTLRRGHHKAFALGTFFGFGFNLGLFGVDGGGRVLFFFTFHIGFSVLFRVGLARATLADVSDNFADVGGVAFFFEDFA